MSDLVVAGSIARLLGPAREVIRRPYTPFPRFPVGAAAHPVSGGIFAGSDGKSPVGIQFVRLPPLALGADDLAPRPA
ncbi:hypothetical protein [Acidiferrobacter sp.]